MDRKFKKNFDGEKGNMEKGEGVGGIARNAEQGYKK